MKKWLSRNLIVLTLVSLTQDAASDLLYPLLPLLLTGVIGAAPLALGVIEGCAEAAAGFSKLYAGKFSDRVGRKPFVISGYTLAGIGKVFVVLATTWPAVLTGRVTDRIGKGMRSSPRDALINDSVPKEHLGKAFGFHRAGDNLGAVIGPGLALIGLSLLNDDVRAVAKWALIPAILSGLLTLFVRETFVKQTKQQVTDSKNYKLTNDVKIRIFTLVAIQLTNIPDALLLLRLHQIGFSAKGVVASYMLFSAVSTLLSYPAGVIADKLNPRIVYAVGLVAFGFGYLTLGLTSNHSLAIVAIVIYGIFPALTDGVGKAWIASVSPSAHRGKVQGVYQSSMNFAVLGAGIWGGAMWSTGSIQWSLVIAGVGSLIGSLVLLIIRPQLVRP
ncbi:MAG: MFS transporter [Actinobacteria bacterium]|jgi:MFS family permease|nr:MFS transporter [Actinomycetota bacterium]